MTVDATPLTDTRLLSALCDTLVPAVDVAADDAAAQTLWGTAATDLAIDQVLASVLPAWAPHVQSLVHATLAALGDDFADADADRRVAVWRDALESDATRPGALILQSTVLAMFYTIPDEQLSNPTWAALGFAGPLLDPPSPDVFPKTLVRETLPDDPAQTLSADAVVC